MPASSITSCKQAMLFATMCPLMVVSYCILDDDIVPTTERPLQRIMGDKLKVSNTACIVREPSIFKAS